MTDGDLRRAMGPGLLQRHVADVMTRAPVTIGPDALAAEALRLMNDAARPITALFVIDGDGRPLGILHIHDLLRAGVGVSVTPMPARGGVRGGAPATGSAVGGFSATPGRGIGSLSGHTMQRRRAPSQAGITRRRVMIKLTKWLLPAAGLALLSSIVLWPQIDRMADSGRVSFRRLGLSDTGQARVVDARYRGINEKGEPYTITAATATQVTPDRVDLVTPKADLTTQAGAWLMLQSEHGVFMQKANMLDLSGHVVLYRDDGTTLNAAASTIDLTQGAAAANVPVHAEGPFGTLDAQGYALIDKGDTVQFTGPAKLVLNGGGS